MLKCKGTWNQGMDHIEKVLHRFRDVEAPSCSTSFCTTGQTAVSQWAGKARPVLDRSFNALCDSARVRVSGFNPCLQGISKYVNECNIIYFYILSRSEAASASCGEPLADRMTSSKPTRTRILHTHARTCRNECM